MTDNSFKDASLPKGVNDFLPELADKIAFIEEKIRKVFELWGFRRIITPLLEFDEVLSMGIGEELKSKGFRFDDRQTGRLLAIPSDMTPQIARIVATRMHSYPLPYRIYYCGRVLRHAEIQSGRNREIFQSGVELIGLSSPEADAEMIAMAVEVMSGLGLKKFKIDLGQVEFFRGIMASSGLEGSSRKMLQDAIAIKDASAVKAILEHEPVSDSVKQEISALPRLFGGQEILAEARRVVSNERSRKALDNLSQVVDILNIHEVGEHLTIDLGEIRGLDYHSGVTFEGFVPGLGEPVCSGGRYDDLTAKYGMSAPATGFAFNTLNLLSALARQPEVEASKTRDFLLFNQKEDRTDVLKIAQSLRSRGFTTARDIIQRDFDSSLAYAKRMNIRKMVVIGSENCGDDEVYIVTVADNKGKKVSKSELLRGDFPLNLEL